MGKFPWGRAKGYEDRLRLLIKTPTPGRNPTLIPAKPPRPKNPPTTSTILRNRCLPNQTGQPRGTITLIGTPPSGFETTEIIYGKIIPPLYGPAPPAFSLSLARARMYNG